MNIKQLKEIIQDLPGKTEVVFWNKNNDDKNLTTAFVGDFGTTPENTEQVLYIKED